jgi:hypothetical protein
MIRIAVKEEAPAFSEAGVNFVRVINKADQRQIGAVGFGGAKDFVRVCAIFWGKSDSWQVCSGLPHKSG